jgi:hypothetical protein
MLVSFITSERISCSNYLLIVGPDLIFESCADSLGRLPGAKFFCFMFFFMILLMGFSATVKL